MMIDKTNLMTIRELNALAHKNGFSKIFRSYTTIRRLIISGKVPAVVEGNRYLIRICDIEAALMPQQAPSASGIRRIE